MTLPAAVPHEPALLAQEAIPDQPPQDSKTAAPGTADRTEEETPAPSGTGLASRLRAAMNRQTPPSQVYDGGESVFPSPVHLSDERLATQQARQASRSERPDEQEKAAPNALPSKDEFDAMVTRLLGYQRLTEAQRLDLGVLIDRAARWEDAVTFLNPLVLLALHDTLTKTRATLALRGRPFDQGARVSLEHEAMYSSQGKPFAPAERAWLAQNLKQAGYALLTLADAPRPAPPRLPAGLASLKLLAPTSLGALSAHHAGQAIRLFEIQAEDTPTRRAVRSAEAAGLLAKAERLYQEHMLEVGRQDAAVAVWFRDTRRSAALEILRALLRQFLQAARDEGDRRNAQAVLKRLEAGLPILATPQREWFRDFTRGMNPDSFGTRNHNPVAAGMHAAQTLALELAAY